MWEPQLLAIVAGTFVLAGMVKGIVGFGMPTVAVALLAATVGLAPAMALMVLPTIVTNIWQALVGGALAEILRRFWPLLVTACVGIFAGVAVLARADPELLSVLLGAVLVLYVLLGLARIELPPPGRRERWLSPVLGLVNGVLTGLTGTFVVPSMLYFQALSLPRDLLVQTMGVLFTLSTAAMAAALAGEGLVTGEAGLLSAAAIIPAIGGMVLGRKVRQRLSEAAFRRVLYLALLALGLYLAVKPLLA